MNFRVGLILAASVFFTGFESGFPVKALPRCARALLKGGCSRVGLAERPLNISPALRLMLPAQPLIMGQPNVFFGAQPQWRNFSKTPLITNSPELDREHDPEVKTFGGEVFDALDTLEAMARDAAEKGQSLDGFQVNAMCYTLGQWGDKEFFGRLKRLAGMGVCVRLITNDPSIKNPTVDGFIKNYWKRDDGSVGSLRSFLLCLQDRGAKIKVHAMDNRGKAHLMHGKLIIIKAPCMEIKCAKDVEPEDIVALAPRYVCSFDGSENPSSSGFKNNHGNINKNMFAPGPVIFCKNGEPYFELSPKDCWVLKRINHQERSFWAHWKNDGRVLRKCSFLDLDDFFKKFPED